MGAALNDRSIDYYTFGEAHSDRFEAMKALLSEKQTTAGEHCSESLSLRQATGQLYKILIQYSVGSGSVFAHVLSSLEGSFGHKMACMIQ